MPDSPTGEQPPRPSWAPGHDSPGPRGRLAPVVGRGRNEVLAAVTEALDGRALDAPALNTRAPGAGHPEGKSASEECAAPLVLVACSGGPDSLALAALTAFFARRGTLRAGAVVVDHGLQPGSDAVAERTATLATGLGLDPVQVVRVAVDRRGTGPEGAARIARYEALDAAAERHAADAVLLGHTLDDQAEQVLLGLARGSGTRSLAGMPAARGVYLRPLLGMRRADTAAVCAAESLLPWHDPANRDRAYTRSRIREDVLPHLEAELGGGIAESLNRSAAILGEDAAYLDAAAAGYFTDLARRAVGEVSMDQQRLRSLAPAMRYRLIALAAVELGGEQPGRRRVLAADRLLARTGSAGPIQLPGHISVYRVKADPAGHGTGTVAHPGAGCDSLVFRYDGT